VPAEPHVTLQRRLLEQLESDPEARALAIYKADGSFVWLTRSELYERAAGATERLVSRGLRPGNICLIVLRGAEVTTRIVLAVLRQGAIPLLMAPPLRGNAKYWSGHFEYVVRKSRARFVVFEKPPITSDNFPRGTTFLQADELIGLGPPQEGWNLQPDTLSPVTMQLTSGTTRAPRICVWNHRALVAVLDTTAEAITLRSSDIILTWTPLYHDLGLVNNFLLSLVEGTPLVLIDPIDFVKNPSIWLQAMSRTGATVSWAPNFGFALATSRVADDDLRDVRLDHVRAFWNGGERVYLNTVREFENRFREYGLRTDGVKTSYGAAENVGGATFSDPAAPIVVEHVDRRILREQGVAKPVERGGSDEHGIAVVSVGRPRPGVEIRITNSRGGSLPDGHVGEIALATPSRMTGYLHDARASQRALRWGLLRMGDLGYRRGHEVFWLGRTSERITIRSTKLDPSDLEPILLSVAGLREGAFAAFGVDDEDTGTQRLVILTEVRMPLARPLEEVSAEIKQRVFLDWAVNVSDLVFVEPGTLTKTSSGKRRHTHFRELYRQGALKRAVASKQGLARRLGRIGGSEPIPSDSSFDRKTQGDFVHRQDRKNRRPEGD